MSHAFGHGESSSSIAFSMNPRDSRVVSIYEKYLYDPKDLESSDPRRRELARKASQLKLHGRPANNMDANGIRQVSGGPNAQRRSISFGQGTKSADRPHPSPAKGTSAPHSNNNGSNQTSHQNHPSSSSNRDSGAFGLGLGMLGGGDSDSDSDSDDDRPRGKSNEQNLDRLKKSNSNAPSRPESWTDRAAAVGQRPPDSASQNPPSLKMMNLKSAKEGGSIPSARGSKQPALSIDTKAVDRTSRHGSTIGFTGPSGDSERRPDERRLSARTALTKQLGLVSPGVPPAHADGYGANPAAQPSQMHANHPQSQQQQNGPPSGYFDRGAPSQTGGPSPPRNAIPPPIDIRRAQQQNPFGDRAIPSPMGSAQSYGSSPNSATPFRSPGYGPPGMPSPQHYPQQSGSAMPPNVLQRGSPSNYAQMPSPNRPQGPPGPGPSPPHPANLRPGGTGPGPRGPPSPNRSQGRGPSPDGRGAPGDNSVGPSFSDAPGPQKQQSMFRRSMAFLGGAPPGPSGPGVGPNATGPQQRSAGPPQKRQSLFRRSMAMLGGSRPAPPPGPGPGPGPQQARMGPPPNPPASPAPRNEGLAADTEKPDHPRKSQFWGAGGQGVEWDTHGEGAKFWRRFSMAQKRAHDQKMEAGSKAWMASMANGRRKLIVMATFALLILVGVIVGVIVWREIISPSGKQSDQPKSTYHANLGAGGTNSSSIATSSSSSSAKKSSSTTTAYQATSSSSGFGTHYVSKREAFNSQNNNTIVHHRNFRAVHHPSAAKMIRKRSIRNSVPLRPFSLNDLD